MSDEKSFIARIEESILKFTKPDYMDNQGNVIEFLSDKQQNTAPVKSIFKSIDFNGMQVFTFGNKNAKNTIVFIQGEPMSMKSTISIIYIAGSCHENWMHMSLHRFTRLLLITKLQKLLSCSLNFIKVYSKTIPISF